MFKTKDEPGTISLHEAIENNEDASRRLSAITADLMSVITGANNGKPYIADHQDTLLKIADQLEDWAKTVGERNKRYQHIVGTIHSLFPTKEG